MLMKFSFHLCRRYTVSADDGLELAGLPQGHSMIATKEKKKKVFVVLR